MPRLAADSHDADRDRQRWSRLAELIAVADRGGLEALSSDELDEFGRLYRRAAADLAAARSRGRDPRLVAYLNGLVGRAAGLIYGGRMRRRLGPRYFFLVTIPRTFRATIAYTGAAFVLFALPAVVSFVATAANPAWSGVLVSPALEELVEGFLSRDVPPGQYFADTQTLIGADNLSGFILVNNVKVALMAFAFGITAGLGTLYALVGNGLMVGGFLGVFAHHGRVLDPIAIIAPHGFLELSAIFMAGGAGLMLGWALIDPGDRLRVDALSQAARQSVVLVTGALVTLGVAAVFEGFVSPQVTGLMREAPARILLGFTTWLALCAWLLAGDRLAPAPSALADEDLRATASPDA